MAQEGTAAGTVVAWDGEWPWLKARVRAARESLALAFAAVPSERIGRAKRAATEADAKLLDATKKTSHYVRSTPQALPAAGVTALTALVTAKSCHRYGLFAGTRNGILVGAVGLVLVFPAEVKAAVTDNAPFDVSGLGFGATQAADK